MPLKDHKPHHPGMPPGPEVTLVVRQGPQQGLRYHLARTETRIGRRKDMDFLLSDATVSAEHARVFFQEGGLWIEDLRSMNGTLVNDRRIRQALLQANDRITLGKYELEVQMEETGPQSEKTQPLEGEPGPSVKAEFKEIWLAGFTPELRRLLIEVVQETLSGHATAFIDGEKILTEFSARLESESGPDLIILDIRIPLISGVNTAIAIRAFEQGFARPLNTPIAFFGQVPDAEAFTKVLKFCKPAIYFPASMRAKEFRLQAVKLIVKVKKELSQKLPNEM